MVAHAQLDRAARVNDCLDVPPEQLEDICRKYRVRSMLLFGSALGDRFTPQTSDIDVAVEFEQRLDLPWHGQVTGLMAELSDLFGREVDVIDQDQVRNQYLRDNIAGRNLLIYGEETTPVNPGTAVMNEQQQQRNRVIGVLTDIINCCDQLLAFVKDKSRDDFLQDKMLQLATERLFITIGEAANGLRKADPQAEQAIASLQQIVAMRNRLVHQYWTADMDLVWDVVTQHVPVLREQANAYRKHYQS